MDLGAILLLIALLLAVGFFLAAPLMRGAGPRFLDEAPEVSTLLAERDRVITALQELDFDFRLGKVPEDAYPEQRATLLQRGVEILRRLDELAPSARQKATTDPGTRIEEAAAAAGGTAQPAGQLPDDKIESLLAARRAARHARSGGFCPRCGRAVLASDRFCPNCGKSLQ